MEGKVSYGKFIILALVAVLLTVASSFIDTASAVVGTDLAVNNVNGGDHCWALLNLFQRNKDLVHIGLFAIFVAVALGLFKPWKWDLKSLTIILLAASATMTSGCYAPYDVPEYVEVGTNQTAFVIPLEGENVDKQVKFGSAKYLEEHKIASKRIQIPHRWNQTGRLWWCDGTYIPTVKVIMVDRAPVTREWKAEGAEKKGKDSAVWTESSDSVGFSMGWTCTAFVKEEDTAQFLYMYPSGSLSGVMDTEVRGRIQQAASMTAAKYRLDDLRGKKTEVANDVKSDLVEFFKNRGITITTVGMFGGMTYENPEIQKSIDQTFVSQQEKVNAAAMLAAQKDKNARIESEASALAEASRRKAQGEADGKLSSYLAEARGIEAVNMAIAKANNNPQLIQLKALEVEKARVDKWGGQYPSTLIGSGANTWVGLQPVSGAVAPAAVTATK